MTTGQIVLKNGDTYISIQQTSHDGYPSNLGQCIVNTLNDECKESGLNSVTELKKLFDYFTSEEVANFNYDYTYLVDVNESTVKINNHEPIILDGKSMPKEFEE